MTAALPADSQPAISSPALQKSRAHIAIISIATIYMVCSTWLTWPDAIYDFGSQLYYPWQMAAGKHLYVDIAYFNGPLSQYFNAAMFAIFGVSLRTLIFVNLAIVIGVITLIYRLLNQLSDSLTATSACLAFVLLFAFSQYVGIGNYNWICPYTHEVTHGVALSLAMIAAIGAMLRTNQLRWGMASGALLGLVFLTKAEVFAPAAGAAGIGLILCHLAPSPGTPGGSSIAGRGEGDFEWKTILDSPNHPHPNPLPAYRERGLQCTAFFLVCFAAVIAIPFALLCVTVNSAVAMRAIAGSWPWVFDRRIAQLQFYRQGLGIDDLAGNLWKMFVIGTVSLIVFATVVTVGSLPKKLRSIPIFLLAGESIAMLCYWKWTLQIARPWPVFLAIIAGISIFKAWKGERGDRLRWTVRAMLSVFAFGLMGKMLLNARFWQYGFALAMPAAVMLIDAIIGCVPTEITRRGGNGKQMRLTGVIVIALLTICIAANQYRSDGITIGTNGDHFLATNRGSEVAGAIKMIDAFTPQNSTLAVMPQGLMLNYLTRRVDSIACVNLMPPEVLSTVEDRIVEQLNSHPPDMVLLSEKDIDGGSFVLTDGQYHYGAKIVAWVTQHYQRIVPSDARSELRLSLWRRMNH